MRVLLDSGALLLFLASAYGIGALFTELPDINAYSHGFPGGLLAVPIVLFVLGCFWHMLRKRHWYWFMVSMFLGPISLPVYYFAIMRQQLAAHVANAQLKPTRLRRAA